MNYYIEQILKEKTITSFLEDRGVFPVKKSGDKLFYICPVHEGDVAPSFIVYPEGTKGREYQTYYCFGCHSGITLVNLKSDIDNVKLKESINFFLKDIKIDSKDVRESLIDDIQNGDTELENTKEAEILFLLLNAHCREHLSIYNDEEEIEFFEKFFNKVDIIARSKNVEMLKQILDILSAKNGLAERVTKFRKRQEDKEISSLTWRM
jgi:hypothetical protein